MSKRSALLVVGLLLILGIGGFVASKSSWVKSWFGREAENAQEMDRLAGATLAPPPPVSAEVGWPQWRGPLRDGRAPAGAIRTDWNANPPKQLWSAPCGGGYGSVAVVGGRLYTQDFFSGGERVLCISAETGKLLWEYRYPADYSPMKAGYTTGPRATPSVVGDRIYAVGAVGKFVCLEPPTDGGSPRLVWEHDLIGEFEAKVPQWGVACSPLVEGGLVIVQPGGKLGSVVAFDRETGTGKWKAGTNPPGYSSPIATTVGGVRLIYAFTGDALLCLRAADGEIMGAYPWKTDFNANIATPIVVDDYVFISSAYNKGCALLRAVPTGDRVKLEEVYARNNRVLRTHHATAVYRDGFLYGFDGTRSTFPKCVDLRKGQDVPDWGESSEVKSGTLILADKHLIVLTERGELALIEAKPNEFNVMANVPSGLSGGDLWALPVLVDGRLYLRGNDKIVCLDVAPAR